MLIEHALWIIVDPWSEQPNDTNGKYNSTYMTIVNDYYCKKIDNYLQEWKVKNVVVALENKFEVNSRLINYQRLNYEDVKIHAEKFRDLVYVGFHHGNCITYNKIIGTEVMSKKWNCYVQHGLVALIGEDKNWIKQDEVASESAVLI